MHLIKSNMLKSKRNIDNNLIESFERGLSAKTYKIYNSVLCYFVKLFLNLKERVRDWR